ncbi:MAG: hypothetical protein FJZ00_13445 [Candidatus Sericytochromatia bacterium]|uniref:Uncharacterized protein n=1 Tax=Candidatus Tanganyikabacteria bacterium TaxID=2961651 RepID=A0A938BKD2_9BACT|nr:hypothetical protein [Candidatus Tanganyikabacteria bacterium]
MTARRFFLAQRRASGALALAAWAVGVGAAAAHASAGAAAAHAAAGAGLPPYPGATAVDVAGATLLTTRDPQPVARAKYAALLQKAGWRPAFPDAVLDGTPPGTPATASAALRQAGTLLSFVRNGRTADIWISAGVDRHRKPVTMLMLMSEQGPKTGGAHGRPAR